MHKISQFAALYNITYVVGSVERALTYKSLNLVRIKTCDERFFLFADKMHIPNFPCDYLRPPKLFHVCVSLHHYFKEFVVSFLKSAIFSARFTYLGFLTHLLKKYR